MKIGISTSVVQRGQTGIARYVCSLTRAFLEQPEHDFYLFVLEEDLPLFAFAKSRARFITVPERYRPAVKNIGWHQTVLPKLARELQLDVLHVPSYRRMLWPHPCPLVATIHDLAPFHVSKKYDWKRMLYARAVVRFLASRQTEIIAISEATARDITTYLGVPRERITVIHNGIDHDRFFPVNQTGSTTQPPFFLYVARLEHPGKNHVRLIEAFNRFKAETRSPWQLALAGSDWSGAEAIHAAIRSSPFASDIRSLGFVSDDDLPNLYRSAGAFVYPSLYEGFGLPPIEAMACGCPVLCSTRGSLAEVIGDAADTLDPEDVSSITAGLTRLATDSTLRETLRRAGLAHAQKFNWQSAAAATLAIYNRALARFSILSMPPSPVPLHHAS